MQSARRAGEDNSSLLNDKEGMVQKMSKRLLAALALALAVLVGGCAGQGNTRLAGPAEPAGIAEGTEESDRQEKARDAEIGDLADFMAGTEASDPEIRNLYDTQDGLATEDGTDPEKVEYTFRNDRLLQSHYEKHGIEMGFSSPEEYEEAACAVVNHPDALHKLEAEDGDDVYYVEETNEFVIVSVDGYIRTYFYPNAGIDYYNRQ